MAILGAYAKWSVMDNNRAPAVGWKLNTYMSGTSTPLATYADTGEVTPNANPVVFDARGEATILFKAAAYKLVLTDALDNVVWTADNYVPQFSNQTTVAVDSVTNVNMYVPWFNSAGMAGQFSASTSASLYFNPSTGTLTSSIVNAKQINLIGVGGDYSLNLQGSVNGGQSYGLLVLAGMSSADYSMRIRNATSTSDYLTIRGDGLITASNLSLAQIVGLGIRDTSAAYDVTMTCASSSVLTAGRTLTLDMVNGGRTLKLGGNLTVAGTASINGTFSAPAFTCTLAGNLTTTGAFNTTLAQQANTTVTLPTTTSTMARTDAAQTFTGVQTFSSPTTYSTDGDQLVISQDVSKLREGSCSAVSGNLYTLLGEMCMKYWTHNFSISSAGAFGLADETEKCTLIALTESGIYAMYYTASQTAGTQITTAMFTLKHKVDSGGSLTAAGGIVGVTDGSNASSGIVGELLVASSGGGVTPAIVSVGTVGTVMASLALTIGDWLIIAEMDSNVSGTNTNFVLAVGTISGTLGGVTDYDGRTMLRGACNVTGGYCAATIAVHATYDGTNIWFNKDSTHVHAGNMLYLNAAWNTASANMFGEISARRMR